MLALNSFREAERYRIAWNELVARSGADIYQTFEWCDVWWKHYGMGRDLHLILCFTGQELVGIIPAFIESLRLGPARLCVAKLIGADFSLTLCNLPVAPCARHSVTTKGIEYFLGRKRCDLLLFGPLSGPTAGIEEILAAGHQLSAIVQEATSLGDSCNSHFELPDRFEDYLKSLDKKKRSNFKRMLEQSAKAYRISFDTVAEASQVNVEFERFHHQHEAQWNAEGRLGHFGDWPHAHDFNRDLIQALGPQGMVRFYRILANEQTISSQYCFVFNHTVYWRLPARVRSPEWERFSLGTVGLVKMIEVSIAEGARAIEGGRGHYSYKVQHGAIEWPLRTVRFVRRGRDVALRVRLFAFCARILDIIYHKVLFTRLAPRLPLLRHTLWPIWIRSTW